MSQSDDLSSACGQLLVVGFDGLRPPATLIDRMARAEVGAVMLFRPNIAEPEQLAQLVGDLRRAAPSPTPLVVAVDQEGGLVQRIREPATRWPDMFSVGAANDLERTQAVGLGLGSELSALGIAWNFAPVLDVHTNPANPVIGPRAFGCTPAVVQTHALAFWRGQRAAGVLGCGKHFPGHGDTQLDSHLALPVVGASVERLTELELAPFRAAVEAGVESLMTAHVMYPAWDPQWPATLSHTIASQLLRQRLGFTGLLASDDLGMKAVAARWSVTEIVERSLMAGVDVFLVRAPEQAQIEAHEALIRLAEKDSEARRRIFQSAERMAAFKQKARVPLPLEGAALRARLGTAEHRALAASFPQTALPSVVSASEVARV